MKKSGIVPDPFFLPYTNIIITVKGGAGRIAFRELTASMRLSIMFIRMGLRDASAEIVDPQVAEILEI